MQKQRHRFALGRTESDPRRDSNRVEISFQNSLHREESRFDSTLANRGQRVISVTHRAEMIVLGREVAVHAECLADFESVKTAGLAIQIQSKRGDQSRQKA